MKVIVSHDVDHLFVGEHIWNDLIIPKQILRSHIELLSGKISWKEYGLRWHELMDGKMHNIPSLHAFNREFQIPATWFFATSKGRGLHYDCSKIIPFVEYLIKDKTQIALHGIEYTKEEILHNEKTKLERILRHPVRGIRMHYLKKNHHTLQKISSLGFLYDSSCYEMKNPYKIGNMWEFPIHVMDGFILEQGKRYQSRNLQQCLKNTFETIDLALKAEIRYFVVDFHDRYFHEKFQTWKKWYIQTMEFFKKNNFVFISFEEAVEELQKSQLNT